MGDEIDLRKYIGVLRKRWWLIFTITALAVIVAVVISFLSPIAYQARTSVLINNTTCEIVFETENITSSPQNTTQMKQAIVDLVKSSSVAAEVIKDLGDTLEPGEQNVTSLQDRVGVSTNGNLIEISVKANTPEKAAAIANAWAQSYVSYANGLYSEMIVSPEEVQAQADDAKKEYGEKEQAYESFMGNNRLDELQRYISDKKLLCNVKSLYEQVEAGSLSETSAAANSLSLILLQSQAFTTLPDGLQLSLDQLPGLDATQAELTQDIEALISTLESRTGGQPGESVEELRQEILQLQGELEQENARQLELKDASDTAWQIYSALNKKVAGLTVGAGAQDVIVQVVAPAIGPGQPVPSHKKMSMAIALVLGLVVGVFGAFGLEYFREGNCATMQVEDQTSGDTADKATKDKEAD